MSEYFNRARLIAIRSGTLRISLSRLEYFLEHGEFEDDHGGGSKIRTKIEKRIARFAKAKRVRIATRKHEAPKSPQPWVIRRINRRRPLVDYDA